MVKTPLIATIFVNPFILLHSFTNTPLPARSLHLVFLSRPDPTPPRIISPSHHTLGFLFLEGLPLLSVWVPFQASSDTTSTMQIPHDIPWYWSSEKVKRFLGITKERFDRDRETIQPSNNNRLSRRDFLQLTLDHLSRCPCGSSYSAASTISQVQTALKNLGKLMLSQHINILGANIRTAPREQSRNQAWSRTFRYTYVYGGETKSFVTTTHKGNISKEFIYQQAFKSFVFPQGTEISDLQLKTNDQDIKYDKGPLTVISGRYKPITFTVSTTQRPFSSRSFDKLVSDFELQEDNYAHLPTFSIPAAYIPPHGWRNTRDKTQLHIYDTVKEILKISKICGFGSAGARLSLAFEILKQVTSCYGGTLKVTAQHTLSARLGIGLVHFTIEHEGAFIMIVMEAEDDKKSDTVAQCFKQLDSAGM